MRHVKVIQRKGIMQDLQEMDGHAMLMSVTCAARSTYIKVRCEGDRTMPLFSEGGEGDHASFSSKPLILVVIHSNAIATIKVRDKKEGAQFFGQVEYFICK